MTALDLAAFLFLALLYSLGSHYKQWLRMKLEVKRKIELAKETIELGDAIEELEDENLRLNAELGIIRAAIWKHRSANGHDRCWLNDLELYRVVDPNVDTMDFNLPELSEFMGHCAMYWQGRQPSKE